MNIQEWKEIAEEAERRSHNKVETIIFQDGTVTTVTGSWEARKPVLLVLPPGKHKAKSIWEAMKTTIDDLKVYEGIDLIEM